MTTTTTSLNDLLPSIVAEALFQASEKSIMRGLVKNYTLNAGQGKTVTVPIYPKQTAASLVEGNVVAFTSVTTNGATLTVAEVGLAAQVSDMAMMASSSNVVSDIGRLFGEAIARKMDSDLLSNAANLNSGVGSASTAANAAVIFQAIAKLRSAGYDTSNDCAIVLHPNVAFDLVSVLTSTFAAPASQIGNDALRNGFMGTLGGVPVYQSSLVNSTGTTGNYNSILLHRDALGLAMMQDIRIESQREATKRGFDIVGTAIYGHGITNNDAGQYLQFNSSIES
jgi:N4-gp56 family major capsid protein